MSAGTIPPRYVECADCDKEVLKADAERIQGRWYCEDCWPDHADEDYPDDSQQ